MVGVDADADVVIVVVPSLPANAIPLIALLPLVLFLALVLAATGGW